MVRESKCIMCDYLSYLSAVKLYNFYGKPVYEDEYCTYTVLQNVSIPIFNINHHCYENEVLDVFTATDYPNVVHVYKMGPYLHNRKGPAILEKSKLHKYKFEYYYIEGLQMLFPEWNEMRNYR